MPIGAITFDFHDTIASCDAWFQIEVRHLVSSYLRWDAGQRGDSLPERLAVAADHQYRRLRLAIHRHGHELPAERCVAVVLDRIGIRHSRERIAEGVERIMRAVEGSVSPKSGAIDSVTALAASGVPLGIVSSAVYHPFLEWTLERFGIHSAFADVTTSASVGFYKSRPEIYWSALHRIGADAKCSVHVGDSWRFDVGGAQRAGMRAVLVENGRQQVPIEGHEPNMVLERLDDSAPQLLELLAGSPTGRFGRAEPVPVHPRR